MCGRYAASADLKDLIEIFEIDHDASGDPGVSLMKTPQSPAAGMPDYNIAPTKAASVVVQRPVPHHDHAHPHTERQLRLMNWGLVPAWSKDTSSSARMINARAETLVTKPAYARAARSRRCLVPAAGWYEWQTSPAATNAKGAPRKQPFFITRADDMPLAMAGLYEFWKAPGDNRSTQASDATAAWLVTFTIITTAAEPGLDRVHHRQPVVLDPDRWAPWLDPELHETADIEGLLTPAPPGRFGLWPVSTAVNAVRNNGPDLLNELPAHDLQGVVDPYTGQILGAP